MKLRDLLEFMDDCKVVVSIESDDTRPYIVLEGMEHVANTVSYELSGRPEALLSYASGTALNSIVRRVTTLDTRIYISTEVDCE